jgi:hypothetical protein
MPAINGFLLRARELRARAEEILAKAETMKDADAREKMREVAASYEKLAQQLERVGGDETQSALHQARGERGHGRARCRGARASVRRASCRLIM